MVPLRVKQSGCASKRLSVPKKCSNLLTIRYFQFLSCYLESQTLSQFLARNNNNCYGSSAGGCVINKKRQLIHSWTKFDIVDLSQRTIYIIRTVGNYCERSTYYVPRTTLQTLIKYTYLINATSTTYLLLFKNDQMDGE